MKASRAVLLFPLAFACASFQACGGSAECPGTFTFNINPPQGTADHTQLPPGNFVTFNAVPVGVPDSRCKPSPESPSQWSVSPATASVALSVNISNDHEVNAICDAATSGPVTLTITQTEGSEIGKGTAQFTCK